MTMVWLTTTLNNTDSNSVNSLLTDTSLKMVNDWTLIVGLHRTSVTHFTVSELSERQTPL